MGKVVDAPSEVRVLLFLLCLTAGGRASAGPAGQTGAAECHGWNRALAAQSAAVSLEPV